MQYENLEPGHFYHVFNQGNNKEDIFYEEKNYAYFLDLLKKYILPITEIYAYCLLPNHFHLLLKINEDVESKKCAQAFSNLFNAYAKAINKTYKRSGSLFRRKFARIRIGNEEYLKKLVLYIHTNSQHHGIVDNFREYSHSSYLAYLSGGKTNICKEYVLGLFGGKLNFKDSHQIKSDEIDAVFNAHLLE